MPAALAFLNETTNSLVISCTGPLIGDLVRSLYESANGLAQKVRKTLKEKECDRAKGGAGERMNVWASTPLGLVWSDLFRAYLKSHNGQKKVTMGA
jgi:hypothetical protein